MILLISVWKIVAGSNIEAERPVRKRAVIRVGDDGDLNHGSGNKSVEKWVGLELEPTGLVDAFDGDQGKRRQR